MRFLALLASVWCVGCTVTPCVAFSVTRRTSARQERHPSQHDTIDSARVSISGDMLASSRREVLLHTTAAIFSLTAPPLLCLSQPAFAANTYVEGTVWLTGKHPQAPGQKPHDKNDVKGSRKDSNFLRSISDCKAQCERSNGADGLARAKEDCLSDCQDICCDSYEQCTFAIVPRI